MKYLFITTLLFFNFIAADAADVNLTGTVKTADGTAIEGARISLKRVPAVSTLTDATGAFTLTGSTESDFTSDSLVAFTRGYQTALLTLSAYDEAQLAVTQTASNMWVPDGAIEHMGGMVKIKASGYDFEMGQPCDSVRGLFLGMATTDVEQPVHTVKFTYDFWMDTTEVTQKVYDDVMSSVYGEKYVRPAWNASNGQGDKFAAYSIEWGSAALFCNALSKHQGLPDTAYSYSGIIGSIGALCTLQTATVNMQANAYRLPTEAEWEYACRGGTSTDYYWGKNFNPYPATAADTQEINNHAIWVKNSFGIGKDNVIQGGPGGDSSYYGAHFVAKRAPNAYGLYDMAGNVSEWCNDLLNYYPWGMVTDFTGEIPDNPTGYSNVRRGGNWSTEASYLRSPERQFASADYEFLFCGFRTVCSHPDFTIGVKKTGSLHRLNVPAISVYSGVIRCSNVKGADIGIFSLTGEKVYTERAVKSTCTMSTKSLSAGSYIVTVNSGKNTVSRQVTLLP